MDKNVKIQSSTPIQNGEKKTVVIKQIKTRQDVKDYIKSHQDWWFLDKLHLFTDYQSLLVKDPLLRQYFIKQVKILKNRLMERQQQKQERLDELGRKGHYTTAGGGWVTEPGDIYGEPQFYRFGEKGRSPKKGKPSGFMKKKY